MPVSIEKSIDSKTGETICRCPIPAELVKEIDSLLGGHQGHLNNFMGMSQQLCELQHRWSEQRGVIKKSDEDIRKKMQFVCKAMGLEEQDPWTYHLQDKCFELREPPEVQPLTASQMKERI